MRSPPPRRLSPTLDKKVRIEAPPFNRELDEAANRFLDSEPMLKRFSEEIETSPERWVAGAADIVQKATRRQHLKALAFAYALWLRSNRNPVYQEFLAQLRQKRKRHNKNTTDLHLLVESVVTYGDDPTIQQKKRGLYHRDVAALRYLHHSRVGPDNVEDWGSKPGQGLDTWARQWATIKATSDQGDSKHVKSTPGITLTVRSNDEDGTIKRERYVVVDNVDTRALIAKLENYRLRHQNHS